VASRSHKLGGTATAALRYYEEGLTAELTANYYSPAGFHHVWGKGAAALGLEHGMTREQSAELYNGRWNGERIVGMGYRHVVDTKTGEEKTVGARTPAIDTVFAAPKSVAEYMVSASPEVRTQINAT